jgi:hypothetical protein
MIGYFIAGSVIMLLGVLTGAAITMASKKENSNGER